MSADRLRAYLDQMRSAALQACDFVAGMELETFLSDARTQMAVGMALVLIGENASRIIPHHPDFVADHPEIPWSKIKGMRNFVVHDYYELELPVVFDTVKLSLPALVSQFDLIRQWRVQGE